MVELNSRSKFLESVNSSSVLDASIKKPKGTPLREAIYDAMKQFGHSEFKPFQKKVIQAVLAGKDVLVSQPTGGGKSLCYQLPALVIPGVAIVVSPLIALQKDQFDYLSKIGIKVGMSNSNLSELENSRMLRGLKNGEFDIFYVSPEKIALQSFRDNLKGQKVGLVAVDEAHCVSLWGHNFRPEYGKIKEFIDVVGSPPVIALTATAPTFMRKQIRQNLGLNDKALDICGPVRRDDIKIKKIKVDDQHSKLPILEEYLRSASHKPGTTIVYFSTVREAEQVYQKLSPRLPYRSVLYNGQMDSDERIKAQELFTKGKANVIFCTNAFGMGVDISSVNKIFHFNPPFSIEAWAQEIGRARSSAEAVLLWSEQDFSLLRARFFGNNPTSQQVLEVYRHMCSGIKQEYFEINRKDPSKYLRYMFEDKSTSFESRSYGSDARRCDIIESSIALMQGAGVLSASFNVPFNGENRRFCYILIPPHEMTTKNFPVTESMTGVASNVDLLRLQSTRELMMSENEDVWDGIEKYFAIKDVPNVDLLKVTDEKIKENSEKCLSILVALIDHPGSLKNLSMMLRGTGGRRGSKHFAELKDICPDILMDIFRDLRRRGYIKLSTSPGGTLGIVTEAGREWLSKENNPQTNKTSKNNKYTAKELISMIDSPGPREELRSIISKQLSGSGKRALVFKDYSAAYFAVGFLDKAFKIKGETVKGKQLVASALKTSGRGLKEWDAQNFLENLFPEL